MFYGFLASLVAGGLTTLFLLWSRSKVQDKLDSASLKLTMKTTECESWKQSWQLLQKTSADQTARFNQEIDTLQKQNDDLLQALQKSGNPGVFAELLQKRNSSGVSSGSGS